MKVRINLWAKPEWHPGVEDDLRKNLLSKGMEGVLVWEPLPPGQCMGFEMIEPDPEKNPEAAWEVRGLVFRAFAAEASRQRAWEVIDA